MIRPTIYHFMLPGYTKRWRHFSAQEIQTPSSQFQPARAWRQRCG